MALEFNTAFFRYQIISIKFDKSLHFNNFDNLQIYQSKKYPCNNNTNSKQVSSLLQGKIPILDIILRIIRLLWISREYIRNIIWVFNHFIHRFWVLQLPVIHILPIHIQKERVLLNFICVTNSRTKSHCGVPF